MSKELLTRNPQINKYYKFIKERLDLYEYKENDIDSKSRIYQLFHLRTLLIIGTKWTIALRFAVKFLELIDNDIQINWDEYEKYLSNELNDLKIKIEEYKKRPLIKRMFNYKDHLTVYKEAKWEYEEAYIHLCHLREFMEKNKENENAK